MVQVYHAYCLGYHVPEGKRWLCPRHFCLGCGEKRSTVYYCRSVSQSVSMDRQKEEGVSIEVPYWRLDSFMLVCRYCPNSACVDHLPPTAHVIDPTRHPKAKESKSQSNSAYSITKLRQGDCGWPLNTLHNLLDVMS